MINIIRNFIIKKYTHFIVKTLNNESIQKIIWKGANIRPESTDFYWHMYPNDIEVEIYRLATNDTAKYVMGNMSNISGTIDRLHLLKYCLLRCPMEGLFLEFGVEEGSSINFISSTIDKRIERDIQQNRLAVSEDIDSLKSKTIHGFDSFQGLPEDWGACKAGAYSTNGHLPKVRSNVKLHVGLFKNTLPDFIKKNPGNVSFMHIDSDLYSSARTVLFSLHERITKGTIIVFDEYFNYPGWRNNEFKAFQEFIVEFNVNYEYIAYCSRGFSVGIVIL
ncbi:MAG: class I SAM-dependent methyltransferase [Deltaproteobacteria bacterium]|nr:class I SAM-dependent methyltransferase [Deltaproteobacteria bacterium]